MNIGDMITYGNIAEKEIVMYPLLYNINYFYAVPTTDDDNVGADEVDIALLYRAHRYNVRSFVLHQYQTGYRMYLLGRELSVWDAEP